MPKARSARFVASETASFRAFSTAFARSRSFASPLPVSVCDVPSLSSTRTTAEYIATHLPSFSGPMNSFSSETMSDDQPLKPKMRLALWIARQHST